jgi:hypothetical protein
VMESLEIIQKDTTSGWWAVIHNGKEVYSSDGIGSVISWLRDFSVFSDWETIPIYLKPQTRS